MCRRCPAAGRARSLLVRPLLACRQGAARSRRSQGRACTPCRRSQQPRSALTRVAAARRDAGARARRLDARRLALLARRVRRAEAAIEVAVDAARAALAPDPWRERGPIVFAARAVRATAGGGRAAPARPRHRAHRRRGAGRTRQARSSFTRRCGSRAARSAPDLGRRARSRSPATGWWSNAHRRAAAAAGAAQPAALRNSR